MQFPHKNPPETGETIEVADGILWMRLPLPMALDHVNIYAIREKTKNDDGWTIIDTGFDTKKTRYSNCMLSTAKIWSNKNK